MRAYLTTADVAALLGVKPQTVLRYRMLSRPGRPYSDRPFPEPDSFVGRAPIWQLDREPELREWFAAKRGSGRPSSTEE